MSANIHMHKATHSMGPHAKFGHDTHTFRVFIERIVFLLHAITYPASTIHVHVYVRISFCFRKSPQFCLNLVVSVLNTNSNTHEVYSIWHNAGSSLVAVRF